VVKLDPQKAADAASASAAAAARRAEVAINTAREAGRTRRARRGDLSASKQKIETALSVVSSLAEVADHPDMRLRRGYLRRAEALNRRAVDPKLDPRRVNEEPGLLKRVRREDLLSKPPLMQLVNRPSPALTLHLVALYMAAACTTKPGARYDNDRGNVHPVADSWATLIADAGIGDQRRRHIVTALSRLSDMRLLEPAAAGHWESWRLLDETGTGRNYLVPGERRNLTVPGSFFSQGWYLVLTAAEIAVWLVLRDMQTFVVSPKSRMEQGIGLSTSTRDGWYGMSDEVYLAHNNLTEFGLIQRMPDSVHDRRAGKVRLSDDRRPLDTFHFRVTDRGLENESVDVVLDSLKRHPRPPRFDERRAPRQ
jgi:hypothetical protein